MAGLLIMLSVHSLDFKLNIDQFCFFFGISLNNLPLIQSSKQLASYMSVLGSVESSPSPIHNYHLHPLPSPATFSH